MSGQGYPMEQKFIERMDYVPYLTKYAASKDNKAFD